MLGPTDMDYLAIEQLSDTATHFLFQLQRNIENPIIHFRNIVGKIAYISSLLLRLGYLVAAAWAISLLASLVARHWFNREIDWSATLGKAISFGWVQLAVVVVAVLLIRRIVIRLSQPDTRPSER